MVNVPDSGAPETTHTVVVEGAFGSATWQVSSELYALMPRNTRDEALEVAGSGRISPFFDELCVRLLKQAGCGGLAIATLDPSWSFETVSVECRFGETVWSVSQGIWDTLPEDQRTMLLELSKKCIHDFFEMQVFQPLYVYAMRTFNG